MKQIKISLLMLTLLFFIIGNITADTDEDKKVYNYEGQIELTLSLGSVSSGDMEMGENSELFIDNSYGGSLKVAYFFSRLAAVEASFTLRFDTAFYIADKSEDYAQFGELATDDFMNYHFNLGLVYNLNDLQHVPYLKFGLGITTLTFDEIYPFSSGDGRFTVYAGFGYKYYISEKMAINVDFGFNAFDYENINGSNEYFMNWLMMAGITFKVK